MFRKIVTVINNHKIWDRSIVAICNNQRTM